MTSITEQKAEIETRIEAAADSVGRDPTAIRILGVSKRQPRERIAEALAAGIRHLGENYLQEAIGKITEFGSGPVWHFIGRIQSNKTRAIAEHFDWVQSVASSKVAGRLSDQRPHHAGELQVCIQIAPRGDERRGGLPPGEIPALAAEIEALPRLRLRGLMLMPAADRSDAELAGEFRAAKQLYESLRRAGHDLDVLSMGMSADLEIAVREGSTMLRIGTALFGPRDPA